VTAIQGIKESLLRLSISRPTMTTKERGGGSVVTIHQSCDRGKEDQDGQHGHIISPGWVSHHPVDHSCNEQGLQNIYKLNIIIL
jgi:hypothetical protein